MRWGVVLSIAKGLNPMAELLLDEWKFGLATAVMVLLAAAGNILNDCFDLKVDLINKPNKVVIDKSLSRNVALSTYFTLNFIAIAVGIFLAYDSSSYLLAVLPIMMAIALWYYSAKFKGSVLVGNFIVSLLVGIVPLWAGILEVPLMVYAKFSRLTNASGFQEVVWWWLFAFAMFAFWLTLIREAQKDLQDTKGDELAGFQTLPVVHGMKTTKRYLTFLYVGLFNGLGVVTWLLNIWLSSKQATLFNAMLTIGVIIPSLYAWWLTLRGKTSKDFGRVSSLSKWIMAVGIIIGTLMPIWYL